VRTVAEDWLRRDQVGNRRVAEVRRILDHDVLPAWGERPIEDIRKRDVIELIDGIADRGSPSMANRTLAHVRRMLNWAAGRDLIEANPAAFVEKPADEIKRERVLSNAELTEMWRACEAVGFPFGHGVMLLLLTLARRAEVFELSEPELDLDGASIMLPPERVKVKEGRTIPLSEPAQRIIADLPRIGEGPYLLSLSGRTPYSGFANGKEALDRRILDARRKADPEAKPMAPWRLHDLRRTGATGLQRLGVRLEVIEAALGHVSGSRAGVVGVYQRHKFADEARAALDSWGRHVEALLRGEKDNVFAMTARR
jgi:integrase